MNNPYAITQKQDGWWLVLNEKCGAHIVGRAPQTKADAVLHSLLAFQSYIESYIDIKISEVENSPSYAEEIVNAGLVDVVNLD